MSFEERLRGAFSFRRNLHALFVPPEGHLRPLDGLRALSILADQTETDVREERGRCDEPHRGREQEGSNEDRVRH